MVWAVGNSYDRISCSNSTDLDHPTIQASNATRTRSVVHVTAHFPCSYSHSFVRGGFVGGLALAKLTVVSQVTNGATDAAFVCGNMDGPAKSF